MITTELVTPRLLLRPLVSQDASAIQQLFPRWEIVRYLIGTIPWPYPPGAAQDYVDNIALPASSAGRGWFWTLRLKTDPRQIIGVICLTDTPENQRGFWLVPEYQGAGYMTEACQVVNHFWFETLDRTVLRTAKAALNLRSRKLSVNSGMRLIRVEKAMYVSGELDSEVWELTREAWRRQTQQGT